MKAELTEKNGGTEPTEEELKTEVDLRILPYMNIVRGWLGLEPVRLSDEQTKDILPDSTLTDEDISGNDQAEDKSQAVTTEQREDVKKEESNFDSQN